MIPTIGIIGRSNVGKTTILEGLIIELKRRGYRIAVAKHLNEDAELDQPGKDSWRLARTGADAVVIGAPNLVAMILPNTQDTGIEQLQHLLSEDYDIFIVEGYKQSNIPKIEVRRNAASGPLCPPDQLIAIVAEEQTTEDVPRFTPGDIKGLAGFIEQTYLTHTSTRLALFVNRQAVPLNSSLEQFFSRTILGMVSAIKDTKAVTSVQLWLGIGRTRKSS